MLDRFNVGVEVRINGVVCESASRVVAPIKRRAFCVGRTLTVCPSSVNPRITPAALYAAMPPVTPTRIRKATQISF